MRADHDAIVVGGGAAGLMCAITAARRGRRVLVLEHTQRCGKKILMSGGGRCNFTNLGTTPAQFLSANPHYCKSALARYSPQDFLALVQAHRIGWHEKELGQLFCNDSSKQIVQMLLSECAQAGVEIRTGCAVEKVTHRGDDGFVLHTTAGQLRAAHLVVATGGLSIPKMGATGWGHQLARQFGHQIVPTRAGLVPLTLSGRPLAELEGLAGVALPVEARCGKQAFAHDLLITHRGVSGPAILQISSYWQPGQPLHLDLRPGHDAADELHAARQQRPASELRTLLSEWWPKRFAQRLCETTLPNRPLRQFSPTELTELGQRLQHWPLIASGTEGYRTAEVTLGGVDTRELDSSTMGSKRQPGLYFIGEVVDVTGWLGGYNFQWAWASGYAAGNAI
ncbi:MAG: NAD(P)/FAD-dependent oxidoreductase [Lysobacterales bacterium]